MELYENTLYKNSVELIAKNEKINYELLKDKKILITGASGLICSFLVDVLMYRNENYNDNIKVYMLCRNEEKIKNRFIYYDLERYNGSNDGNLIYIVQDVCSAFEFDENFNYIIHGASNTHPKQYSTDPVGTINTNVIGLYNILNYSVKYKPERIFMMSSVEIYGENKNDVLKFDENYLGYINCNTLRAGYPESKRLSESLCQAYISQYDLDIVIGRFSRVYGPTMRSDDSKALAQFIKNAVNNEDIVLKSEGNQLFSYTYMCDAVSAILFILLYGKNGEAYNISDEKSDVQLKDLAKILADYNGKKVVFEIPDETERKGYSTATKDVLDSTKLKNLGWEPLFSIEKGLNDTIDILKNS